METDFIVAYYIDGENLDGVPNSYEAAKRHSLRTEIHVSSLNAEKKWEHLVQGGTWLAPNGWVSLRDLASTRRGIATGANGFFLISLSLSKRAGIEEHNLKPCIGKAQNVPNLVFSVEDFDGLARADQNVFLIDFKGQLTPKERSYVSAGEEAGFQKRFLTRGRTPWFSMEQREAAPIWASVFTRVGLRFVWNQAGCYNLTNFHCVYPKSQNPDFAGALVSVLNSSLVVSASEGSLRRYGGGLSKFEPADLLDIPVPDIRAATASELAELCRLLRASDEAVRSHSRITEMDQQVCKIITNIAARIC